MKRSMLATALSVLFLAACASSKPLVGADRDMIGTIQTYETALLSGNQTVFLSMVCQQDVASMQAKFDQMTAVKLSVTGIYSASSIVFNQVARSDDLVLLDIVSGKGRINTTVGNDSIPLNLPPFSINNKIVLKQENGGWKLCFGATAEALALKPLSTGNSGLTVADVAGLARTFVFAASGLILIFSGLRSLRAADRKASQNRSLQAAGVPTQAEIIDLSKPFTVTYRFATQDGATVEHKTRVVATDYNTLKVGDRLDVRYDPKTPDIQLIERGVTEQYTAQNSRRIAYVYLGVGLLMIATLLVVVLYTLR